MIWNGDCVVPGCEREAVYYDGLCRKHRGDHNDRHVAFVWVIGVAFIVFIVVWTAVTKPL